MIAQGCAPMGSNVTQKVNVSMVSLKWGDFLSTLLPGALALFALAGFFPAMDTRLHNIEQIGTTFGVVLLIAAALVGELLGVFARVVWERFWLIPHCKPPDALKLAHYPRMGSGRFLRW